jgi:hypothetical protein
MASINDLAAAASALVNPAVAAPHPSSSVPDSAAAAAAAAAAAPVARGALIVLEGLDRSGKTTQVKLLEQRFVELGRKVKVMRFPGTYFVLCHALLHSQLECCSSWWDVPVIRGLGHCEVTGEKAVGMAAEQRERERQAAIFCALVRFTAMMDMIC